MNNIMGDTNLYNTIVRIMRLKGLDFDMEDEIVINYYDKTEVGYIYKPYTLLDLGIPLQTHIQFRGTKTDIVIGIDRIILHTYSVYEKHVINTYNSKGLKPLIDILLNCSGKVETSYYDCDTIINIGIPVDISDEELELLSRLS